MDLENRPLFPKRKKKTIIQKVSERHERNVEICVVITAEMCVPKITILGKKF